jgi:hypothetical protein
MLQQLRALLRSDDDLVELEQGVVWRSGVAGAGDAGEQQTGKPERLLLGARPAHRG